MSGTAYIHIGLSKTGTTSIQLAMAENAERLRREHSINYPRFSANHWPIALLFLADQDFVPLDNHLKRGRGTLADVRAMAEQFAADMAVEAARYDVHVISAEQLQLLNAESASAMKCFFDRLGLKSKIIAYVRHPVDRLSSLVNQKVRAGQTSLRDFPIVDTVTPTLRDYTAIFGRENMIVRRFGRQYFRDGDLMADFISTFRQEPLPWLKARNLNESLSAPAVLIADRLVEIAPLDYGSRGDDDFLTRIVGPRFLAPRAMAERTLEVHQDCLAYLEQAFGVRFDDVDLSIFPEMVERNFSEETIASLARILNEQSRLIDGLRQAETEKRPGRSQKSLRQRVARLLRRLFSSDG